MDIRVSGRQVDIGESLRMHIAERIDSNIARFFNGGLSVSVTISRQGNDFGADCTILAPRGVLLRSHAEGGDAYTAFDDAADKIEKQLRRYKRRLKNHHTQNNDREAAVEAAHAFVIKAEGGDGEGQGDAGDNPVIIAETKTEIPAVSVKDAVMLMDLADSPAFLFRNAGDQQLNVVYRRSDGHIGWIAPGPTEQS